MLRSLLSIFSAVLLLLAVSRCGDEEAREGRPEASARPDGVRLARVGTLGDYPPEESTVVVNVDKEGTLRVGEEVLDYSSLRDVFVRHADGAREGTPPGASTRYVVIRIDRGLPWREAQWIMLACADPRVRICRVHFAVLPEQGDEEGTLAAWLPKDRGLARTLVRLDEDPPLRVCLTNDGPPVDPAALFLPAREWVKRVREGSGEEVVVQCDVGERVPVGFVLRSLDVLYRAGVDGVVLVGAPPPRPARAGAASPSGGGGGPGIRLAGEALAPEAPGGDALPAGRRIRGGFAGNTSCRFVPPEEILSDILEGSPAERATPPDAGQPGEDSTGEDGWKPGVEDFLDDAPFDGPSTNEALGIGVGVDRAFGGRGQRRSLVARGGGNSKTEDAVSLGLKWLFEHQDPGGYWDCDQFMQRDKVTPVCDGAGNPLYDPGVSGLALLAFLGAGETHKDGRYKETVRQGLKYLRQIQDPEGCFGPRTTNHFTYNHAIAALAMAEVYGLTESPIYKQSAQGGVDFIARCQNPYLAWRYGVRPHDNDTSVSGWMLSALKSARTAGLRVPEECFDGMKAWLDRVTEPEHGRVGYTSRGTGPARPQQLMDRYPSDLSESLTAVGILSRIFTGEDPRVSELIQKGSELCLKALPVWDESSGAIDMCYWYYGSLAMFQVGGSAWDRWNEALKPAIVDHQRKDGAFRGSWDPVGPWGAEGGRVCSTALMVLCMEVYYRYDRTFGSGR